MKRILLAAGLLMAVSSSGFAADLPVKAPPPAVAPVVYNWSGFYIGGFAGGDWLRSTRSYDAIGDHFVPGLSSISASSSGFVGGGMIGAQWQLGNWVLGLEGSGAWSSINRSFASPFLSPVGSDPVALSDRITSIFTATAKVGWTWDRVLWYVKGGYANVGLETAAADPIPHTATDRRRHNGWTVGTGLDYMVTQNWIIGVEYDYIRLNSATHSQFPVSGVAPAAPTFYATSITGDLHQIVARLSYKFDWGGPIVARY
jgi:outer membrane immunogenic protein